MKKIDSHSTVADIVSENFRTAPVFRRHGIDFCCMGKQSLETACRTHAVDTDALKTELENVLLAYNPRSAQYFENWSIGFITDFLTHTHHQYLREVLPETAELLSEFVEGHRKKYPSLTELPEIFNALIKEILPHLAHEEAIIFPYMRQIADAYLSKASYAGLLVRTLRKPLEQVMHHENKSVDTAFGRMRELTDRYTPPERACIKHRVVFFQLQEIDRDFELHLHLENNILFPKAMQMEKELLQD